MDGISILWQLAQYGLAIFSMGGIIYVVNLLMKQKSGPNLCDVINNNTKAINELTTILQVTLARQEAKLDEILERIRR